MKLRAWIQHNTRSRSFLWKMTIGIIVAGIAAGAGLEYVRPAGGADRPTYPSGVMMIGGSSDTPADPRTWLDPWLATDGTDFADVIEALRELRDGTMGRPHRAPDPIAADDLISAIERSLDDETRRTIAIEFVRSLERGSATEALADLADAEPPPRYANYARGLVFDGRASATALVREADIHDSDRARRMIVEMHTARGDTEWLDRMKADVKYGPLIGEGAALQIAMQKRDWWGIFVWHWPATLEGVHPIFVALGAVSGLVWLVFLLTASGIRNLWNGRVALCLAGVVMGVLSIPVTLFAYTWLDMELGFDMGPNPDLRHGLLYCIAGIGLTEELCKLLLFLPLAPILVKRGSALEMLVVAGCVGLGFAAEENITYFSDSGGAAAAGRLLTANFGHIVETGLAGFALCQAMMFPRERTIDFLIVFFGVVVSHGLYDAFIMVPALSDYGIVSSIIYIIIVRQFFVELKRYTRFDQRTVSLTATFLGGFAVMIALTIMLQSWRAGIEPAIAAVIPGTLGAAIFTFVFFREIDEPLHP